MPSAWRRRVAALLVGTGLLAVQPSALAEASTAAAAGLPLNSLLWSLRATVGSWVVLMLVVCVLVWRGPGIQVARRRFALWACVLTLPLPWIAMISGWLALELGQQPHVSATLAAQSGAPATGHGAAMLAWGCAYAVLMLFNVKLSLRWLRLESPVPQQRYGADDQSASPLVDGSRRYRVGEFQSSQFGGDEPSEPLQLAQVVNGKTYDVDKLRRAIVRLRKERNALRKVVQSSSKRSSQRTERPALPALPAPQEEAGDTQMIPVLRDVIRVRRNS